MVRPTVLDNNFVARMSVVGLTGYGLSFNVRATLISLVVKNSTSNDVPVSHYTRLLWENKAKIAFRLIAIVNNGRHQQLQQVWFLI